MAGTKATKRRRPNWFLWWRVDPWEVKREVEDYDRMPLQKSARGISMLLLVASSALTLVMILVQRKGFGGLLDVGLGVGIGLFVLGRNRWSKIAAMVYWTLEKLVLILAGLMGPLHGFGSFGQLLFWVVYMRYFYLALQVERQRRLPAARIEAVFG